MFGCGAGVVLTDAVVAGAPHAASSATTDNPGSETPRRVALWTEMAEWEEEVTVGVR
jgi:hypothetical protein